MYTEIIISLEEMGFYGDLIFSFFFFLLFTVTFPLEDLMCLLKHTRTNEK